MQIRPLLMVVLGGAAVGLLLLTRAGRNEREAAREPAPASEVGAAAPAPEEAPLDPTAPAGRVEGTVRDALTGQPLPRVDVIFSVAAGDVTASSGDDGRFAVALAPGRYQVRAAGDDLFGASPAPLVVAPGARITSYDLRVARVAHVRGRVRRADGSPAAGAAVSFATETPAGRVTSADLDAAGVARADATGHFELTVMPGDVTLLATDAVGAGSGRLRLPWVAPGTRLESAEIVIDAGTRVAGIVLAPDGAPVAGAEVGLQGVRRAGRRTVNTDGDGRFTFDAVPSESFLLEARARGFAPTLTTIEVAGAPKDSLTLRLRPARVLRGRVLAPDGTPAGGVRVVAYRQSALDAPAATTAADGSFELVDLDAAAYGLVARKDGFAAARAHDVTAPADGVELRLGALGGIAGTVTSSATGAPVTDFTVRIVSGELATGVPLAAEQSARFAAGDGAFLLERLEPGSYLLHVVAPGHAPGRRRVTVPPGAVVDASLALAAGATVEGRVVDARSGAPIEGARVEALTGADEQAVFTGADGRFVIDDVAPGRRSIDADHPGYVGRSESGVVLAAGQRTTVDIRLTPLDPAAAGQGGARPVEFAGIGAQIAGRPDGSLVIAGVVPGGPAEAAGLRAGDTLVAVDETPVAGRELPDVIEDIRGVAGTYVRIRFSRAGQEQSVDIVRGTVRFGG